MEEDSQGRLSEILVQGISSEQSVLEYNFENEQHTINPKRNLQSNNQQHSKRNFENHKDAKQHQLNEGQFDISKFINSSQSGNFRETLDKSKNSSSPQELLDPVKQKNQRITSSNNTTRKNIMRYITDKSINLVFRNRKDSAPWKEKCIQSNISQKQFEVHFKKIQKNIKGLQNLQQIFLSDESKPKDKEMKKIFTNELEKVVRKKYIIYLLKKGKMRDYNPYIQIKNKRVLYLADHVQSIMKMSYT